MKNANKILYISFDGICDSLGRSQVLPYLIGLQKKGYQVSILSAEKESVFSAHKELVQSILSKHNIAWIHTFYFNKPPVIGPVLLKNKLKALAYKLQEEHGFDLVHCRSYLAAMIGLSMKKQFGTKFIFDMRGFWADERVDGKVWNLKNPIFKAVYHYIKHKEKQLLKGADYSITLTHSAKSIISNWPYVKDSNCKIEVVPCCADLDHFNTLKVSYEAKLAYAKELEIDEDDFVLSYLGSIGTWYMLDEMLDFYKALLVHKPQAKFLFISKEATFIHERCKAKGIDTGNVKVKAVTYDKVPSILSLSSFAIFFILPVFSKKASSPIKQGEIMAMKIPIVCNSGVGDTDRVIEKYEAGILVKSFNTAAYEEAISQIKANSFDKEKIRKGAQAFYSLEKGVESYHKVYQNVLAK